MIKCSDKIEVDFTPRGMVVKVGGQTASITSVGELQKEYWEQATCREKIEMVLSVFPYIPVCPSWVWVTILMPSGVPARGIKIGIKRERPYS